MSNIKLKLTKETLVDSKELRAIKIYENDYYIVREDIYNLGFSTISCKSKEKYIPWISVNVNLYDDCNIESFSIDTCSYGVLKEEEIKKVIHGYNAALETVEQLKKMYIE